MPTLLVVTDLDGSLLDEVTFSPFAARQALAALKDRQVPLVLCSSKTRAEMAPLAQTLGLDAPLIVESGGAVVSRIAGRTGWRRDGDEWLLELGVARSRLTHALDEIAAETGARVHAFARLSVAEITQITRLPPRLAELACRRSYEEPFVLEDDRSLGALVQAARGRGLRVTRGERFYHLTGATDKGRAFREVLALYGAAPPETVGLGHAPNDLPFLEIVDRPILIPRKGGRVDPELAASLPRAECAPAPGPPGWNRAVLAVLAGERLPEVGTAP